MSNELGFQPQQTFYSPYPYPHYAVPAYYGAVNAPQPAYYRAPQQPLTFVLVHGSWVNAGWWDRVASALRQNGHTVYVPEYVNPNVDQSKVTHAQLVKSVTDYIKSKDLKNIILVGHSFGGTIIQKAAEQIPDRIKRLVFLNAFVLKDGESTAEEIPPATKSAFEQILKASGNNTITLPYPVFRDGFVNLADEALARQMYSQSRPEPAGPLFAKLDLKKFYALQTPKSYVYLTEDNVLPQGEGFGFHPHMSIRLGPFRLIKDHGDHLSTAQTAPARVAERLYEAARD